MDAELLTTLTVYVTILSSLCSIKEGNQLETIKKDFSDLEDATVDLQVASRSLLHGTPSGQSIDKVFAVQDFQAMQCVWANKV